MHTPRVSGTQITEVLGVPDYSKVCTSHVERQNLDTIAVKIVRFHRLTLAFSRKLANLKVAAALYFWSYNFCLIHRSLRDYTGNGGRYHRSDLGIGRISRMKIKIAHYRGWAIR